MAPFALVLIHMDEDTIPRINPLWGYQFDFHVSPRIIIKAVPAKPHHF
jgi:hypothetical protein